MTTLEILKKAKEASKSALLLDSDTKNKALLYMADAILENAKEIIEVNTSDCINAAGKISDVMLDRLMLDEKRINSMANGIREVAELPDPVGRVLAREVNKDGLKIEKISVPLGVTAIIYESRPNVTSDAAALCLKSGNACVLRSGKEAFATSHAIIKAMKSGLKKAGVDEDFINIVDDPTRQSATEIMKAKGLVDLLIPRGGAGLIRACVENADVPCIETGTGICHVYVDASADFDMALNIVENAKASRPSVCNSEEVLLVDEKVADKFLPLLKERLCGDGAKHKIELRPDKRAAEILGLPEGTAADFDTEFLDYILAVGVVNGVDAAIEHIAKHSTHHSDAIVTKTPENARKFTSLVDSAAVYVNASTRFTDGGVFGLGCEMGISTQKLHARGPMGLNELNTYKYVVTGNGQIRE